MLHLVKRWRATALCIVAIGACGETDVDRPPNRPPTLVDKLASTDEDVAVDLRVLDGASDPDGDALTVISASAGEHHTDVVDGNIVRLIPKQDFHGNVVVSFQVSDGRRSVPGHVDVVVHPVNDAPVAAGGTLDIHGSDPVTLSGSDVDDDALSFEVVGRPASGNLTGTPPALRYTPDAGFIGDDEITYRVSDGITVSEPATLRLRVGPGVAPVAQAAALSMIEDGQLALTLQATDADGSALTFRVVTPPEHGTLDGTPPNLTFAPDPDFNGDVALEFTATDGYLTSNSAIVTIRVAPLNDPPTATPQAVPTTEDTGIDITLAGGDVDGDGLTFRIGRGPSHGTLSNLTGARVTYTPDRDFTGTDSFTFIASDGPSSSATATIDLNVAAADDPPVAMSFARPINEDVPGPVILVGSDVDGDPLSYAITRSPERGALEGTPPNMTYKPRP
jgi:large repetitive protein